MRRFVETENLEEAMEIVSFTSRKYFRDCIFKDLDKATVDDSVFENCTFVGEINKSIFYNCHFIKCEMSNVRFIDSGIHSSLVEKCHMVGVNFIESSIKYCDFVANQMQMSILSDLTFKSTVFKDTNMVDTSFINTKLGDISFLDVNLSNAEIVRTSMKNVDVTSAKIEGLRITPDDVRGMIVTEEEAIELINILGVSIK